MDDKLLKARTNILKSGSMLLLVLSLVGLVYFFSQLKQYRYIGRDMSPSSITVSGKGEVVVIPDIATVTYSVREEAKTAAEAQQLATRKGNDLKAFLKEKKIADKDVKTVEYTISPKYEYQYNSTVCQVGYCPPGRQVITGYTVTESVEVKIRNLDDAGTVLAGIGQRNVSDISGLVFGVDDQDKVESEARAKAIENAKEQADKLADSLGVSIVRVMSFNEDANYPRPYAGAMLMKADAGVSAPSVSPGENKVVSNVSVTYEIR